MEQLLLCTTHKLTNESLFAKALHDDLLVLLLVVLRNSPPMPAPLLPREASQFSAIKNSSSGRNNGKTLIRTNLTISHKSILGLPLVVVTVFGSFLRLLSVMHLGTGELSWALNN